LKLITSSIHDHLEVTEVLVQHGTSIFINIKVKQINYSFVQQRAKRKVAIDYRERIWQIIDGNGWTLMKRRGKCAGTSETAKAIRKQGQLKITPLYVRQAKHLDR